MPSVLMLGALTLGSACQREAARAGAEAAPPRPASTERGEDQDSPTPALEPAAALEPAPVDEPPAPVVDPSHRLDAPPRYQRLSIRASLPIGPRYANLFYEGNNNHFRGKPDAAGLFRSGDETAADWRTYAAGTGGLIVLRDSLFSQQDHPTTQAPRALMMPPMWVSVAVAETMAGRKLSSPRTGALDDDGAWAGEDIQAYFGSFPVSERLFTDAGRALAGASETDQALTRNARRSMQALARATAAMADASAGGPEQVAQAGAEWIAASDRSYFGTALRQTSVIPIFVEHPNEHESRDEGKGMIPWGVALDPKAVALAQQAVYARRLEDGPMAIERYDLRSADDRRRAIAVAEALVPGGSTGASLYLWVNGGSDGHGAGDPATPHVAGFRTELERADVALERVVLFSKPSVQPWGDGAETILEAALEQHAALDIPLSAQLRTSQLRALLGD